MMPYLRTSITAILVITCCFSYAQKDEWRNLLDQDLSQWDMYLSYRHAGDYNGEAPKDINGQLIEPVGHNKNESNVFSVFSENDHPILRVSGEIYGCIYTKQEYENYHLQLKVKWGEKKWVPRTEKLKDSGILYHSVGEAGVDYWRAWMLSQEFQIMEGHMGDYWGIANSAIDVRAFTPESIMNAVAGNEQPFLPIGPGTGRDGFCLRSEDRESTANEWTTLDLICLGDKSLHIVNGEVVMVLQDSRYVEEDSKTYPLTRGKIQLQSEAAEVYFKDIRIRGIEEMPEDYARYFRE